jgi:hypothetical protein
MLTGSELLAKVKEIGEASKSDLVRGCGYVSSKKDGSERLNFTAFYEALLEAKGVSLGEGGGKVAAGKGGRKLSYVATVQGNGNLLVGKAYTATATCWWARPTRLCWISSREMNSRSSSVASRSGWCPPAAATTKSDQR